MSKTVLILGATGRFGRHTATAFTKHGWQVRTFDRQRDTLIDAAQGVDVIVNGWNPFYPDWQVQIPKLTAQIIAAAQASNATVIIPGNVYVFGPDAPPVLDQDTPHHAQHPLGKVRVQMEAAYRGSGVRTILLRAGDFIDTEASGNWFDKIMIAKLDKQRFVYPGTPDIPHAWAYLPDLAEAVVQLTEMRESLAVFEDIPFPGYSLTGQQMAETLAKISEHPVRLKSMGWLPLRLLSPVWAMAKHLVEMRYLWTMPHQLDNHRFQALLPNFQVTPFHRAVKDVLSLSC